MSWFYGIIRKAEEVVLATRLAQLPDELQQLIRARGGEGYHLGAYVPAEDTTYIYLPDFKRAIDEKREGVMRGRLGEDASFAQMSDERFERIFMNKFLDTLEHESLHSAMDKEIKEWVKGEVDNFNEQITMRVLRRFIETSDSPDSLVNRANLRNMAIPRLTEILTVSATNLVHEILVRMLLQRDSALSSNQLKEYVMLYSKVIVNEIRDMVTDLPANASIEDDVNEFYQMVLSLMSGFWSEYMKVYYDFSLEYTSGVIVETINEALEEL